MRLESVIVVFVYVLARFELAYSFAISQLLKDLTYDTGYDKRIRPNFGGAPVEVGVTMHVISISDVSEEAMAFTVDLYLRQTWKDPRLAFEPQDIEGKQVQTLNAGGDYIEKIWKPDTFFSNAKDSRLHIAPVNNAFVRIDSDGRAVENG